MNSCTERLKNGIITENPTFVMMLGMCPTLAVTSSAINGLGMGLTTTAVLILSNVFISLLRKVIPDKVRIPAFIVIVATFVTLIQLLLQAYLPSLNKALGVYIPLIVVNCIILGRAEAYASKNPVLPSAFDGLGMGLGFTFGLTCIGICREILGAGAIFGHQFIPDDYHITFFVLAPGAFLVLSFLTAIQNKLKMPSATNVEKADDEIACGGNCASCVGNCSVANKGLVEAERAAQKARQKQKPQRRRRQQRKQRLKPRLRPRRRKPLLTGRRIDGSGRIICDHYIINAGQQRRIEPVPWYLSIPWCIEKG